MSDPMVFTGSKLCDIGRDFPTFSLDAENSGVNSGLYQRADASDLNDSFRVLMALYDYVDSAYQTARRQVFDTLPAGVSPQHRELTFKQRMALRRLEAAEAALRGFRHERLIGERA